MKYKALCSDIDGTLLNKNRELSPRTIRAFQLINEKIPIVLASSRMPSAMYHLQEQLGILGHPLICFNGGYVIQHDADGDQLNIISSLSISHQVCKDIVERGTAEGTHISLFSRDLWFAHGLDYWTEKEQRVTKVTAKIKNPIKVVEKWEEEDLNIHKIMVMGDESKIYELYKWMISHYSLDIHIYRSKSTYLEIAPKSVSKASALASLLKQKFNIEMEDVVAFGDNYNDIELIQDVGMGIAVGNAREEVKAVANEVTLSNVDDGVAVSIEQIFR